MNKFEVGDIVTFSADTEGNHHAIVLKGGPEDYWIQWQCCGRERTNFPVRELIPHPHLTKLDINIQVN